MAKLLLVLVGRKGLIGENGARKQAFHVLQEFYARKVAAATAP